MSTVRAPPSYRLPQTRASKVSRENTRPRLAARKRQQRELFGREGDSPPLDADLVRGPVDQERADLQALFGGELAPAPLERPDPRVELRRHARHDDEVVEAARRVEARDLPGGG